MLNIQDITRVGVPLRIIQTSIVVYFMVSLIACNTETKNVKETKVTSKDSVTQAADTVFSANEDSVPQNIQVDSIIHISFAPGTNTISVKGHLDKRGDPVICYLPVVKGKTLTASVTPDNDKATIRISHIYLPNGSSDGPFGQTLKYKLEHRGLYKLYVGPNKMAGDPASTDFVLHVKVD